MKVLFTTPVLEHPPAGGPQLRITNSIKALSRVCELHIVSRVSRARLGGAAAEAFFRSLAMSFTYAPSCAWQSPNRYLQKAQSIIDGALGAGLRLDIAALLRFVDQHGIDVVWLGYGNISFPLIKALRWARPDLRLVCDTDSVWSRFVLRELPYVSDDRRRKLVEKTGRVKEAEERAWVELCDVTTAVSNIDEDYYRGIASMPSRVRRFSNVIDLDSYRDVPPPAPGLRRPAVFLAGTFGRAESPMNVAASWLIHEVMPLVRRAEPDVHLYIVGSGSDRMPRPDANSGVTIAGKVPSVLPYLCHADVSVVPLKFESGTRFKILEAAACGIPIVSTVLGAEGLPVADGEHLHLADEPAAFADAIVDTTRDPVGAAERAAACRDLVRRQFSINALEREALEILAFLDTPGVSPAQRASAMRNPEA